MNDDAPGAVTPAPYAPRLAPPPLPPGTIQAPPGHEVFLVGHAIGSQNYICLPSPSPGTGFEWVLFGPQATLFDHEGHQIVTHFASPAPPASDPTNPVATWQGNDSSAVWATREKSMDSPDGSIPWLLLKAVATAQGKGGGHALAKTTYVQRVDTTGGTQPKAQCASSSDAGHKNFVPYTANYYFYRLAEPDC